jgi:hypothetical protein
MSIPKKLELGFLLKDHNGLADPLGELDWAPRPGQVLELPARVPDTMVLEGGILQKSTNRLSRGLLHAISSLAERYLATELPSKST